MEIYKNYREILKARIPEKVLRLMEKINVGNSKGEESMLVGGCVRDLIIGNVPNDFDFAISLSPDDSMRLMEKRGIKFIPTGLAHGTITMVFEDENFEITSLRKDVSTDGRHAEVDYDMVGWKEDSSRRDLTFNALYMNNSFDIIDYHNGLYDLINGNLRFIGSADKRIKEDFLRILRSFRFFCRFAFSKPFPDEVRSAIIENLYGLKLLSRERIQKELLFIFRNVNCDSAICEMILMGVVDTIFDSNIKKTADVVIICQSLREFVLKIESPIMRFAFFARLISLNIDKLDLKFSKKESKLIDLFVSFNISGDFTKNYMKYIYIYNDSVYNALLTISMIEGLITKDSFHDVISNTSAFKKLPYPVFPVVGADVIKLGKSGKNIGIAMELLLNIWLDSNCSYTKQELLNKLN